MKHDEIVPLSQLFKEKYGQIICYPECNNNELKQRLDELKKLGILSIEFLGKRFVFNTPVLGKGCVGIVVIAHNNEGKIALKIRRTDSDRRSMLHEAEMLRKANRLGIGPHFIGVSKNFLMMSFVDGILLPLWIKTLKGRGTGLRLRRVLLEIMEQCLLLDEEGLDHGELHRAPKHIIIDSHENVYLVDFETASATRRVTNITSVSQYLFLRSIVAKEIRKKLGTIDEEKLIEALGKYKETHNRKDFEKILKVCKIIPASTKITESLNKVQSK